MPAIPHQQAADPAALRDSDLTALLCRLLRPQRPALADAVAAAGGPAVAAIARLCRQGVLGSRRPGSVEELAGLAPRLICIPQQGQPVLLEAGGNRTFTVNAGAAGAARSVTASSLERLFPCEVLYPLPRSDGAARVVPGAGVAVYLKLTAQVLGLAMPICMLLIIDKVVTQGAQNTLVALLAGVALLTLFQYLFLWVYAVHAVRQAELLAHDQRAATFQALLASRAGARWASLGWDVVNACLDRARFQVETRPQFAADCCYVLLLAVLMGAFNPWLLLVSAAFVPLYLIVDVWGGARVRRHMAGCTELRSALAARHFESAAAVEEIRALDLSGYVAARWLDTDVELAAGRYRATLLSRLTALGVEFLQKLSLILIALLGVGAVIGGTMTLGQYIAFNLLSMQLAAPVLRMAAYRRGRDEHQLALQAADQLMERCAGEAWDPGGSLPFSAQRQTTLHVDRVVMTHAGHGTGRALSFAVSAGGWVGITGPSGCGKSTLLRAIAGLEVPASGNVRLNGLAVRHIDRQDLARQLRLVAQRPVVFSASLAENIRLGDPAASPQQIAAVARVCGLLGLAEGLPDHLNTVVGPAGQTLSGGEMQRLVLARALLSRPRVLLLDEATAALDLPGETALLRDVRAFLPNAVVLLVTHRQSSLAQCGQVLRMDAAVPKQPISLAAAAG